MKLVGDLRELIQSLCEGDARDFIPDLFQKDCDIETGLKLVGTILDRCDENQEHLHRMSMEECDGLALEGYERRKPCVDLLRHGLDSLTLQKEELDEFRETGLILGDVVIFGGMNFSHQDSCNSSSGYCVLAHRENDSIAREYREPSEELRSCHDVASSATMVVGRFKENYPDCHNTICIGLGDQGYKTERLAELLGLVDEMQAFRAALTPRTK